MRKLWSKTGFRITAAGVLALFILLVALLRYYRISSYEDYLNYRWLQHEHAVAMDLWHGRFGAGTKLEQVRAKFEPHLLLQYDGYVVARYYPNPPDDRFVNLTGVNVIAKDGVLICAAAWCCTRSLTFFTPESQKEIAEFNAAYKKHRDAAAAAYDESG